MNKRALTDVMKKEICQVIYEVWIMNPELRLGQLISNKISPQDLFYIEDFELIKLVARK